MLEPGRDVGEKSEARGVGPGKSVLSKPADLVEYLFSEVNRISSFLHTFDEPGTKLLQARAAPPCRHRASQPVCLARREACSHDCELHYLFLKDGDTESALQHLLHRIGRVGDGFQSLPAAQIGLHHSSLARARPYDSDLNRAVIELFRFQSRQHGHLGARFDLKYTDGIGVLDHFEYRLVISTIADLRHRRRRLSMSAHEL